MSGSPKSSPTGLAHLEQIAFTSGAEAAARYLQELLGPEGVSRSYSVVDHGTRVDRLDVSDSDDISYSSFDPPSTWNLPYSIQLVHFGQKRKHDFMFHEGEELLVPLQGRIQYHFFWSNDLRQPKESTLDHPLRPSQIIRVNPMIPHHTWSVPHESLAWMVFRHASGFSNGLVVSGEGSSKPRRRITAAKLREPGRYALTAWGLSETIRAARQRSQLTVAELASHVGTSPSSLSRVEEGRANVSLELLLKIGRVLNLSFTESILASQWAHEVGDFPKTSKGWHPLLRRTKHCSHSLHPSFLSLDEDERSTQSTSDKYPGAFSSWIVLEGQLLMDLTHLNGRSVLLDTGSVAHFCASAEIDIHALRNTRLLKISSSPSCNCAE
jgi:transcriptional regulator with XRE-family HTH domain